MALGNGVSTGSVRLPLGYFSSRATEGDDTKRRLEEVFGSFDDITFHTLLVASDIIHISITRTMPNGQVKDEGIYGGWAESEHRLRNGGKISITTYDDDEDIVVVTLSPPK